MKLLRKSRSSKKKTTLGNFTKLVLMIDELKKKGAIRTTDQGAFYLYPEILIGPTPDNIIKNLYTYARVTDLIKTGQTLYIRHIEENTLIGQYNPKNGYILAS